jgi:hypothetical protein
MGNMAGTEISPEDVSDALLQATPINWLLHEVSQISDWSVNEFSSNISFVFIVWSIISQIFFFQKFAKCYKK